MRQVRAIVCALATSLTAATSLPLQAETVVRWASSAGMSTWEPLANDSWSKSGLHQVYEGLVLNGADLTLHPGLAVSWALVAPDRWRFELRRGVRFHDGAPLTAEDVVFSLDRARGEGSELAYTAAGIAAVTAIDEHTVEIATARPELLLPVKLRHLLIVSKAWAERHGAELPTRSGDPSAYTLAHEDGTGPFVLESFDPGSRRAVLVRNPDWWGAAAYPHGIDRIVWTAEPDPERRLALLLDGEVDFLNDPPLDRLDRLRDAPGIRLARTGGLLTVFLGLDQGSAELRTSDIKGRNPFADRRVRQAVYQAIDIQALISEALRGNAVPAGMIAAPGVDGYDPALDRRLPYDPGRARALLAEAGYPSGFAVRLDCGETRREACPAVAAQLAAVGVRVTVDTVPYEVLRPRLAARATDLYVNGDQAGITLDSAEVLREVFHSPPVWWGAATGYADPGFEALLDRIDAELSSPIRDALIEQAWRTVLDDLVVVPLYRPLVVWAMRDSFQLPIGPINVPYFREAQVTSAPVH